MRTMLISSLGALLESWGLGPAWSGPIAIGTALLLLALGAWIVDRVIRRVLALREISLVTRPAYAASVASLVGPCGVPCPEARALAVA